MATFLCIFVLYLYHILGIPGMLMTRTDLLQLRSLADAKRLVSLDCIPSSFQDDFNRFFFGKTLVKKNNQLFAYPGDIRNWVGYVFDKYKN